MTIINNQSSIINANAARRFDTETGLYYYRARSYNATIGRFLQTDPVRTGMNPYTYCSNNPVCFADSFGLSDAPVVRGWPMPGQWALVPHISARRLITWYFLGNGVGLWFVGGHASELLTEAIRQDVQNWFVHKNWAVVKGILTYPYELGEIHAPLGYAQFDTTGWPGYEDAVREVLGRVDASDPAIKNLLGGGALYMDGPWTREWNADRTRCTITIRATYSLVDTADFHWTPFKPKWHPEDMIGKILGVFWNTGGWPLNGPIAAWLWIMGTRCRGAVAQPYDIVVQTYTLLTVIVYERNKFTIVSEFP